MYESSNESFGYDESIEGLDGLLVSVRSYSDGSGKRIDFPDGTVSFQKTDGFNTTYHANGDVTSFDPLPNVFTSTTATEIEINAIELEMHIRNSLGLQDK